MKILHILFIIKSIVSQSPGVIVMIKTNTTTYQVQKSNTCYNFKSEEGINSLFVPTDNIQVDFFNQCDCVGNYTLIGYTGFHKYDPDKQIKSFKVAFYASGCKLI